MDSKHGDTTPLDNPKVRRPHKPRVPQSGNTPKVVKNTARPAANENPAGELKLKKNRAPATKKPSPPEDFSNVLALFNTAFGSSQSKESLFSRFDQRTIQSTAKKVEPLGEELNEDGTSKKREQELITDLRGIFSELFGGGTREDVIVTRTVRTFDSTKSHKNKPNTFTVRNGQIGDNNGSRIEELSDSDSDSPVEVKTKNKGHDTIDGAKKSTKAKVRKPKPMEESNGNSPEPIKKETEKRGPRNGANTRHGAEAPEPAKTMRSKPNDTDTTLHSVRRRRANKPEPVKEEE